MTASHPVVACEMCETTAGAIHAATSAYIEARCTTTRVITRGNVVESTGLDKVDAVDERVQEAQRRLASLNARVVE